MGYLNKVNDIKLLGWIMKTPGYIKIQISLLTILMISSVSSTVLQIIKIADNTSAVNTSGSLEPQKVKNGK